MKSSVSHNSWLTLFSLRQLTKTGEVVDCGVARQQLRTRALRPHFEPFAEPASAVIAVRLLHSNGLRRSTLLATEDRSIDLATD